MALQFIIGALVTVCAIGGAFAEAGDVTTVYLVPHTHLDTGWLRTVDQYYEEDVRFILDSIVTELQRNASRRFTFVEMAFLRRWWDDKASEPAMRTALQQLVDNGQLEILMGGEVMADEGCTTYKAVMNQLTTGHAWLRDTLGVVPRIAWHIDDFGASSGIASLFAGGCGWVCIDEQ
jgi:hypothetical protein